MIRRHVPLALLLSSGLAFAACGDNVGITIQADVPTESVDQSASEPDPESAQDGGASEPDQVDTEEPTTTDEELAQARAYLDADFMDAFDAAAADCIVIDMVDSLGLARLAELDVNQGPIDQSDIDALLDALYGCVGADELGALLSAEMVGASDLSIPDEAMSCVIAAYADRSTVEALLEAGFAGDDPNADPTDDAAAAAIAPLVECVGFGGLMKQQAAADGVELSDSTVQCLNDEGNDVFTELVSGILRGNTLGQGGEAEQQVVTLLLGCLSTEELAQMNG